MTVTAAWKSQYAFWLLLPLTHGLKIATTKSDERMVGYYHSHPPGESLDFSDQNKSFGIGQGSQTGTKDIQEADGQRIAYYLINSEGVMKRYDPPKEVGIGGGHTTELGKIDTTC